MRPSGVLLVLGVNLGLVAVLPADPGGGRRRPPPPPLQGFHLDGERVDLALVLLVPPRGQEDREQRTAPHPPPPMLRIGSRVYELAELEIRPASDEDGEADSQGRHRIAHVRARLVESEEAEAASWLGAWLPGTTRHHKDRPGGSLEGELWHHRGGGGHGPPGADILLDATVTRGPRTGRLLASPPPPPPHRPDAAPWTR